MDLSESDWGLYVEEYLNFIVVLLTAHQANAAFILSTIQTTQNFNGLASNATSVSALDSGAWRFSATGTGNAPTWSNASNVTTVLAASNATGIITGGRYNLGGASTDRALGVMTSGSFSSPNSLMLQMINSTGGTVTSINFGFDWERFRINSAAASGTFFASSNGSTWTPIASGNSGAFATGSSSYGSPINSMINAVSVSGSITGLSINNGENYYLRWDFITSGSNSQAIGIDNLSITAVPEPTSMVLVGLVGAAGVAVRARRRLAKKA